MLPWVKKNIQDYVPFKLPFILCWSPCLFIAWDKCIGCIIKMKLIRVFFSLFKVSDIIIFKWWTYWFLQCIAMIALCCSPCNVLWVIFGVFNTYRIEIVTKQSLTRLSSEKELFALVEDVFCFFDRLKMLQLVHSRY